MLAKQKIAEPDYSNLELSELQETLIKTLPIINNPSEYEENIINKYAEYNSDERKELLKDCWTVTKLANEHNIKRQEVQKAILTDEFLDKDLIAVFKVNPNNVRSLKILYRKPLIEKQETEKLKKETLGEIKEEPVLVVKNVEKENQKEKNSTSTKIIQNNKTDKDNKKQKESRKKRIIW